MEDVKPLIFDEFAGQPPAKRLLTYLQKKKSQGKKIAGFYCGYAPMELIHAMGVVPAGLCAFADATIAKAEEVLPANLCPLIKSSYGFIVSDTCPFYGISDVIIGETTCDGKKKMFELISKYKPTHVMDLPQVPETEEAVNNWTAMIRKLQRFLESSFDMSASDDDIEAAIKETNKRNQIMRKITGFMAEEPSVVDWGEIYEINFLLQGAPFSEVQSILEDALNTLEERKASGYTCSNPGAPRVLVTGCPIAGDAEKVFNIIDEAGGVIVALDACSGFKPYAEDIEEDTGNPVRTLAKHYLKIPCSCMTPNGRRLTEMSRMIDQFRPDAVIDVVLQACHSFNVESYKVGRHVQEKHNLPFLKIMTDYSHSDIGQLKTRVEALLESCEKN